MLFTFCFLSAQDLHIYYDTQTEILRYEVNGEVTHKPMAKRGNNVYLHVENFNNYIYKAEVTVNETEIISSVSGDVRGNPLAALMGDTGIPSFSLLSSGGGSGYEPVDIYDGESFDEEGDGFIMGFAQAESSSALAALQLEFNNSLTNIKTTETELVDISNEVKNEVESRKIYGLVANEIEKLKYNAELKPEQIKSLANEYLRKVFNVEKVEEVDLKYVIERSDMKSLMNNRYIELKKKKNTYEKQINKLENIGSRFTAIPDVEKNIGFINQSIKQVNKSSKDVIKATDEDLATLEELIQKSDVQDVQYLADLRYEYEAIMNNDFSYTFRSPARGDAVQFNVRFVKRDALADGAEAISKAPIEVEVSGGIHVNPSVGISFAGFSDPLQEYYIRDGEIAANDKDEILPMLTSFVHFYKQSSGNVSLGGSLGVGFPISSGNSLSSISFMAGPSVIIGKRSRVILSGGVMTGQAERLSQGFNAGDSFSSDASLVPTQNQYELGYFFGLSYNLGG